VWSMHTLKCLMHRYADVNIMGLACTPDNKLVYTVGKQYIKCWKLIDLACINVLLSHATRSTTIAHSGDGRIFAVGSEVSPEILLYNAHTNPDVESDPEIAAGRMAGNKKMYRMFDLTYENHHIEKVNSVAISITPKQKLAISASDDATVRFWDFENPTKFEFLYGQSCSRSSDGFPLIHDVAHSKDGHYFALAGNDGFVYVSRVEGKKICSHAKVPAHFRDTKIANPTAGSTYESWYKFISFCAECRAVEFSSDGKWLISGGTDHMVSVWNFEKKSKLSLKGHSDWVTSIAIPTDDSLIASG